MKRCFSLFLILVLIVTSCDCAFADTLRLPASLTVIEDEAFCGDRSLDVVEIPWGTETIGSKAFADSSVTTVYIPMTVYGIADDAFDGCSVTIYADAGSYAREYAERIQWAWQDCGDHYIQDAMDKLGEIDIDDVSLSERIEKLELLSRADIDDAEMLAMIDEYNAMIGEVNALIDQYNAGLTEYENAVGEIKNLASNTAVEETDDTVIVSYGQNQLVLDKDLYSDQGEIADVSFAENGDLELLLANGKTLVFATEGNTAYFTSDSSEALRSKAASTAMQSRNAAIDIARGPGTGYAVTTGSIVVKNQIDTLKKIDRQVSNSTSRMDALQRRARRLGLTKSANEIVACRSKNRAFLTLNQARLSRWALAAKAFAGADAAMFALSAAALYAEWDYAESLGACGHATEEDLYSERAEIAIEYENNLEHLKRILRSEAAMLSMQSALLACSLGGKSLPIHVQIGIAVGLLIRGLMLQSKKERLIKALEEADPQLHSSVGGIVTDAQTGAPIKDVRVTNGRSSTVTNESGTYYMPLLPGEHTLVFTHDRYFKENVAVTLQEYDHQNKDMELRSKNALVYGTVRDAETGDPIPDTLIYSEASTISDAEGKYSLSLSAGSHRITYKAYGYKPSVLPMTLSEGQQINVDWVLQKYPEEQLGLVEGYIYDADTMERLPGAEIFIDDGETPLLLSNLYGYYSIYLPLKETRLTFKAEGYTDYITKVTPKYGETVRADALMHSGTQTSRVDIWTYIALADTCGLLSGLGPTALAERGYFDYVYIDAPGIHVSWEGGETVTGNDGRASIVYEGNPVTVHLTGTAYYKGALRPTLDVDCYFTIEEVGENQYSIGNKNTNVKMVYDEETNYYRFEAEVAWYQYSGLYD